MILRVLILFGVTTVLAACGGSDDDSVSNPGVPQPTPESVGRFIDSPVENLEYRNLTGTRSGVTNANGEFTYQPGETLEFSIGDLKFPTVTGAEVITPMDIAKTLDITSDRVNNMVRLLLTLDQDADASNGIRLTDTARSVATQVDFDLTAAEFAASSAVTNLIFNGGQNTPPAELVSVDAARSHFEQQLIANDIEYGTVSQRNEQTILQYLADNNLQATATESGMYYIITSEGTGESPVSTSTVTVRYKGYLPDGTVFDQTTGDNTATFNLGGLITGWRIGVPLMKEGGSAVFLFPASLGYGSSGSGIIPPNSVIIFEIDLVSFQ